MFRGKDTDQGRRRPSERSKTRAYSYYGSVANERRPASPEKVIDLGNVSGRLRLVPTAIAALVILGSILFSFTLSSLPSVSLTDGTESVYRDPDEYASAMQQLLEQKLTNRTKLTIQTTEVERMLLERFPELDAAALRLPVLGRRPSLVLSINQPMLLLATASRTYVLDRDGVAVGFADELPFEAKDGLPLVRDQSGLEVSMGAQIVTSETVSFILESRAHLSAAGLTIEELVLPARVNELDIRIEELGFFVKTDVSGDARLQIGSFLAVREHLAEQGTAPREYVDVRVEEKVFYK